VMFFEPDPIIMVMMVGMMRTIVCHSMSISLMRKKMHMFIQVLTTIIIVTLPSMSESSHIRAVNCIVTTVEFPLPTAFFA
jgi:hypothetical protein